MRRRRIVHGLLLLAVTAGVGAAVSTALPVAVAQSISITGRVVDGAAWGIPGVTAVAIPHTGGEARTVVSGDNGTDTVEDLPYGNFGLEGELTMRPPAIFSKRDTWRR